MPIIDYQAVVLAGGEDKRLFPLTSSQPSALVTVANKPMLSYPLKTLADAGLKHAFVVVSGEKPSAAISSWLQTEYQASGSGLQCEVVTVSEDCGTADALRAVAPKITSNTFVVISGDLVTDVHLTPLVATHQMHGALTTISLCPRKTSPSSETKPGKAPKNVDYIGMDPSKENLLFYASSREAIRDLKLPMSLIRRHGTMNISSNLVDAHLYVFSKALLGVLESHKNLTSLRSDLLPFLAHQQLRLRPQQTAAILRASSGFFGEEARDNLDSCFFGGAPGLKNVPGDRYMEMSHTAQGPAHASADTHFGLMRIHMVQPSNYCARINDLRSYGEVNREVADPNMALHLTGMQASRYDNVVAASASLGSKTTVAAGCVIGENCVVGDKSSIKRSILGSGVKLGTNVKVINSVLMDNCVVGDNCTIQNSILCAAVQLKEKASLKDCQVGPAYIVSGGVEFKDEILAKGNAPK